MTRSRQVRVARLIYLTILAGAFIWLVSTRWDTIGAVFETARAGWLIVAWISSFGLLWWGAAFWSSAMRALGSPLPVARAVQASARSLLARYIPGSVWYAVGRVGLLAKEGFDAARLTTTAALEIATSIVVVFCLGTATLGIAGALPGGNWWLIPSLAAASIALSRPVVNRAIGWWSGRTGRPIPELSGASYVRFALWMVGYWIWAAATFSFYLEAFPDIGDWPILEVSGSFMIAWGTGFLAPIAPQGLGVFEGALTALLGVGTDVFIVVAGYRALLVIRDVVANAVAELSSRRSGAARRGSPQRD
jgi:hypothetical protein